MYDAIVLAEKFRYTELSASRIMCHLLNAVEYLHHLNITHRNICLENILVSTSSVRVLVVVTSGVARKSFRGSKSRGSGGQKSPSGVQGRIADDFTMKKMRTYDPRLG